MRNTLRARSAVRKYCIVPALLAILACGCGRRPYWPLEQGNEWVYQEHLKSGSVPTGDVRFAVRSVSKTKQGVKAVLEVYRDANPDPIQEVELTQTPGGIYESRRTVLLNDDSGNQVVSNKPLGGAPPYLIPARPEVGQTWPLNFESRDMAFETVSEFTGTGMIETMERVNPKAGAFKALRVAWRANHTQNPEYENRFMWFVRGIGPVKIELQISNESSVLMLKKARIGRKKIGKW